MKKWPFLCILTLVLLLGTYFFLRKEHKTLLIIGCARSGTAYISKVLQESSLQIKHERMGADRTCSWPLTARPDEKKRRVHLKNFQFSHVFHQVRHPLKAISSIYFTEDRHAWNYILKNVPEIKMQDSHLVKCAKYWYYWNLKAEQFAEWTYRIEDLDSIWGEFEKRLGKTLQTTALQRIPKNVNTCGSHQVFSWEDLQRELTPQFYENIRHLSAKYGYLLPLLENNEGGKIDASSF